jgi:GH15 family glucan-1,4-alpha-glucosidase
MIVGFGKAICSGWREPDQSLWEFRGPEQHFTHSKLMCWVGMDRMAKLVKKFGWNLSYDPAAEAEKIREWIETKGYREERQAYTQYFGSDGLDSSVLVMPIVGYCKASSPRFLSTLRKIENELVLDGLVHRYGSSSEGLPFPEGSFVICNFWMAEAYAHLGDFKKSESYLMAIVNRANELGLLAEEMDPVSGHYLGNYPQSFSHIGWINAHLTLAEQKLIRSKEEKTA